MLQPHVSILLPVRNGARTLDRAIESICGQSFEAWELLVIDDASEDESVRIAEAWRSRDHRIRPLSSPGRGIVEALNWGLAHSSGSLIGRMDADDECHPRRLERQVAFLDQNGDVGLVGCLVEFGGDPTQAAGYALHVSWMNSLRSPEEIALNRFIESPLAHPTVVFRRALVERFGTYRSGDFPEDYELWLRWMGEGVRMAKVPETLLTWSDPPERLSRTDPRYSPKAFFEVKAPFVAAEIRRVAAEQTRTREIWVWGAGRHTRKRAAGLESAGVAIAGYIDVDPKKTGRVLELQKRPVISPMHLPEPHEAFVLGYVSSRGARDLIRAQLRARGFREGSDFLICA